MAWRVVVPFFDLQDGDYAYFVGDVFPRKGKTVSDERLAYLSGTKTRHKRPVIEKVPARKKKKEG